MSSRFFRIFPPPSIMNMKTVGLDITDDAVRFISLVKSRNVEAGCYEVEAYGEQLLPEGLVDAGFIKDEKVLTQILTDFTKKYSLKYVNASLPEEKMYLFTTDMPATSNVREINQNIEFKLEENVPVPPSNALFTYTLMNRAPAGKIRASVSVAPRKVVDAYLSVYENAGLVPLSFSVQAEGLLRSVCLPRFIGAHVLTHTMHHKTGIYIVCDGVVWFTSTVNIGSVDYDNAVATALGVKVEEVQEITKTHGHHENVDTKKVFEAIKPVLETLRGEIAKVISFWRSHHEDNEIRSVILCGREGMISGAIDYLARGSGTTFELSNVWANACMFDRYIPPIPADQAFDYAVAIGMAIKDNSK